MRQSRGHHDAGLHQRTRRGLEEIAEDSSPAGHPLAAALRSHEVEPSEEVELTLTAHGVADGTPITVEIFQCRRSGEELCLESFDEVVEGGTLALRWRVLLRRPPRR